MLAAIDNLDMILHELGASAYRELEPPFTRARVRRAVRHCRQVPVLGAVASAAEEAEELADWLRPLAEDVTITPVDEGFLVVAYRPVPPQVRALRRPAWSTPDAQPVHGATYEDLSQTALKQWLERATSEERHQVPRVGSNEDQQLGSWGLLALDGEVWRPTVAAMVLGGRRPEVFLSGCELRGEIDGVPGQLRGGVSSMLQGLGRRLGEGHRALVGYVVRHALLHRDWSSGEPITVSLLQGRLTVSYPGSLEQTPANPLLLHLAAELGMDVGKEGLAKVDAFLKAARLPKSTLFERDGSVRFVADLAHPHRPRRPAAAPRQEPTNHEPTQVDPPVEASRCPPAGRARSTPPPPIPVQTAAPPAPPAVLPRDPEDRANAVLARGRATTREVAAIMGCSRPVIGKVLTALVADGRVTKIAASPRSPFQAYEIALDTARS